MLKGRNDYRGMVIFVPGCGKCYTHQFFGGRLFTILVRAPSRLASPIKLRSRLCMINGNQHRRNTWNRLIDEVEHSVEQIPTMKCSYELKIHTSEDWNGAASFHERFFRNGDGEISYTFKGINICYGPKRIQYILTFPPGT